MFILFISISGDLNPGFWGGGGLVHFAVIVMQQCIDRLMTLFSTAADKQQGSLLW